ncbi:hypothetical protein [Agrobacterium tumefaciens]|uniref:hypothetical protein n=1 Tax=Agrobacterium tumefaciens TaxID=358 RepID=UPI003BA28FB3
MNILSYPLGYLFLTDQDGRSLYKRNLVAIITITALISLPFIFANANFFGDKGFLDRIGGFSAVLTGFYIAGLVGIASFSSSVGDLDVVIVHGPISRRTIDGEKEDLTRREYVSSMFGYLSFVSLSMSIAFILLIVLAGAKDDVLAWVRKVPEIEPYVTNFIGLVRTTTIILCSLVVAHLFVTTCHGLYYMIDRLYHKEPRLLNKRGVSEESGSSD